MELEPEEEDYEEPFCGKCGNPANIKWESSSVGGNVGSYLEYFPVSVCCDADLYVDAELTIPYCLIIKPMNQKF